MSNAPTYLDDRRAANNYQMSLDIEPGPGDVIEQSIDQASAWLRAKKDWDAELDRNRFQYQPKRDLLTLHHQSSSGREFRMRLTEEAPTGLWRTQLTVSEPRVGDPWLALQVSNSEGRSAAVPGLAGNLLDALTTKDGFSVVSPDVLLVTPTNVEDFLERLTDPHRRGLFFVAATTEGQPGFEAFAARARRWVHQARGLAQMAVLSPDATETVADALGEHHAVAPWTLRTFLPDADPAVRSDGFRHKYLTQSRLARENDGAVQQLVGRIARKFAYLRPPIDGYIEADRVLRRLEDRTLVESIVDFLPDEPEASTESKAAIETADVPPRPSLPSSDTISTADVLRREKAELVDVLDQVKATLGLKELNAEALDAMATRVAQSEAIGTSMRLVENQLNARESHAARLEAEIVALREQFDDLQIDYRVSDEDVSRLRDENRFLKGRLAAEGDFDAAYGVIPDSEYTRYPENFDELLQRCVDLEAQGVVFTGDASTTLGLDEYDTLGTAARAAWDGFLALTDYLRARTSGDCAGGIREYMRETPHGYRSMPSNKFGGKETKETMKRWGHERAFPVPRAVSTSGSAVMEAHFKLAPIGMVSPRMYFLDCFATDQRVYVGYIGAHLTNTQT